MRLLVFLSVFGIMFYLLYVWFNDYQTSVEENTDTPAGLEGGIFAPIDAADTAAEAMSRGLGG